jgi:hypothetical protein
MMLSDADHDRLTTLIYAILDAASARQVSRMEAMAALAHVITAAAIGNEGEVRGWLEPQTVSAWLRACSRNNTSGASYDRDGQDGPIESHAAIPPAPVAVQARPWLANPDSRRSCPDRPSGSSDTSRAANAR